MEWSRRSQSTIWVNDKGALVGITYGIPSYTGEVLILYQAPGAEERLNEVEQAVADKQIQDAGEDMSGL